MMVNLPWLTGSCPNFLRPTYPYTECRLSSLTGSTPHGEYYCQLQLLFLLFVTDQLLPARIQIVSVDALSLQASVGLTDDADCFRTVIFRFCFQNPGQPPAFYPEAGQDSGIVIQYRNISLSFMQLMSVRIPAGLCLSSFFQGHIPLPFSGLCI